MNWIPTPTGALLNLEHVALIEIQPCASEFLVLATLGRLAQHPTTSASNKPRRPAQNQPDLNTTEVLLAVLPTAKEAEAYKQDLAAQIAHSGSGILKITSLKRAKSQRQAASTTRQQNGLGSGKSTIRGRRS